VSGFEELADGTIVWEDIEPSNFRVDAAIYEDFASEFDCDYASGQLYHHDAGGGPPYAVAYNEPGSCPARIWIREDVDVFDGSVDRVVLSDEDLRARGYLRVHGPMPDPLAGGLEGRVYWCDVCEADVCEDDTSDCAVCGEPVHLHLGSAVALVDPSEGGLDSEAGTFVILELQFMTSVLIGGGDFRDRALARVGDLPARVDTDRAGAPLCRTCAQDLRAGPRPVASPDDGLSTRAPAAAGLTGPAQREGSIADDRPRCSSIRRRCSARARPPARRDPATGEQVDGRDGVGLLSQAHPLGHRGDNVLTEHRTTIKTILLTTTPDGSLGIVLGFPVAGFTVPFARADVSAAWLASLIDALGQGSLSFGDAVSYACRVRVDSRASLFAMGHATDNRWFNVRPTSARPEPVTRPSAVERALRHLNKQRALRGRRPLNRWVAGYTDDDVIADALHYGWKG